MARTLTFSRIAMTADYHVALVSGNSQRWSFPDHGHEFVETFCVTAGEGRHTIEGRDEARVTPGSVATLLPGQVHALRGTSAAPPLTLINVALAPVVWTQFCALAGHPAGSGPTGTDDASVDVFSRLLSTAPDGHTARDLMRFLIGLLDHCADPRPDAGRSAWPDRLLAAADREDVIRDGLTRLLDHLAVSYSHLARLCRSELGTTPTRLINRARVAKARQLLATTSMPAMAVGQRCGFATISHFYAVFRTETGTTPAAFRAGLTSGLVVPWPSAGARPVASTSGLAPGRVTAR